MPVGTVGTVKVNIPKDLEENMGALKKDALTMREKIGGMSNADRAAMWGKIGKSNVAPDFFDGKINKNEEESFLKLAKTIGPIKVLKNIAKQGTVDPGIGVLHRHDKLGSWLGGGFSSYAVIQGTATEAGKGDGAKMQVQIEYKSTKAETRKLMDMIARDDIKLDTDAAGKTKHLKARFNVEADIRDDGIRNLHLTASVDGVPAVDALKLLKEIGNEEADFPLALPLKIMMQQGANFSANFNPITGGNIGLTASLGALEDFDRRIPDAMLSANVDGEMKKIDGKQYFDVGNLDISLDSRLNVLWDDQGKIRIEYQGEDGKFKPYNTGDNLGMELEESIVIFLLAAAMNDVVI